MCAAERGLRFIRRLRELAPNASLVICSFKEEEWEPPFLDQIRTFALDHDASFIEARDVGARRHGAFWSTTEVDLIFAVGWRYIVPPTVYSLARLGAYVFHDSLLPAYRGFSPTVWAMVNGEARTGVSLLVMGEAADAGDLVDQESIDIGATERIAAVMERVTSTYLAILERRLPELIAGTARATPQDHARATYACKRLPDDNRIDWRHPAKQINDLIRAVSEPYPGAWTLIHARRMRIWRAELPLVAQRYIGSVPGRVVGIDSDSGALVLTGDGVLRVSKVQLDGSADVLPASAVIDRTTLTLGP